MASPQWKSYQPPVQDPAILAFQRSVSITSSLSSPVLSQGTPTSTTTSQPASAVSLQSVNNSIRETGYIEKILHSYGFIQCCDREARLFFHFSEYSGSLEEMKVGDSVEFQMSFDRRTGKPIAISVVRLDEAPVPFECLNENKVVGTVVAEAKPIKCRGGTDNGDGFGRVSYEQSGEVFFLPFSIDDVENGCKLTSGDQVNFHIITDKRSGSIRAYKVCLLSEPIAEKYHGVVCSMKDNFGFIERSDVVREIFFHYSEYQGDINELILGDDVEFSIQFRNGKEVAVAIHRLPEGTVIFEDVAVERRRGRITKTLKAPHSRRQSDPLAGKITYETLKGPIEIPFGDKDQKGDYTLQVDDFVEFNIATDRRDGLQRATNIMLVEDTFKVNGEIRERSRVFQGIIATVKDAFGFIRCAEQDTRMFFHFSEMMEPEREIKKGEEVEFTVIQDPAAPNRQIAIRIKYLPKGTVTFESVLPTKYLGNIEKEAASAKNSAKKMDLDPGIIMYDVNGTKQTIPYGSNVIIGSPPKYGDMVEFQICESRKNNTKTAVSVSVAGSRQVLGNQQHGFVATLKENFGFIETAEHDREIFFHFSAFAGDPGELDLGDEVEFTLSRKTSKVSAENIRKLPKGTVAGEDVQPGVLDGKIIRCLRIVNPEQDEYPGLVQVGVDDDPKAETYQYGITSLADKRDFLQKGDIVKFQVAKVKATGKKRATCIAAVRKYVRATVDSVKGQFGFLNYEAEEGKKLFFHMTEVHDSADIHTGDEVEFVVVQNQRNGKYSACSVRKIMERKRPDRLISRLKSVGDETGPKIITLRQPRGPDGTKGFKQERTLWVQQAN